MSRFFKSAALIAGLTLVSLTVGYSQDLTAAAAENPKYIEVLKGRADKIVNTLSIHDRGKETKVRDLIVMQYYNLSKIHEGRDAQIETLEKQQTEDGRNVERKVRAIKAKAEKNVKRLHRKYLAQLSTEIDEAQIDKIKDGMTYGVVPITYKAYLNLLPDLTDVQKNKIREYLLVARELAMDAGSSEEKHRCFGKYKGKINNYLAANGYDLKAAEKALKERSKGK